MPKSRRKITVNREFELSALYPCCAEVAPDDSFRELFSLYSFFGEQNATVRTTAALSVASP